VINRNIRFVVIIQRITEYWLLAPIIEEALTKPWSVECWHDTSWSREGLKGYQFPDLESVPKFVNGQPQFFGFDGALEFRALIRERQAAIIVSMKPPSVYYEKRPLEDKSVWLTVQHAVDTLITHSPERLLTSDLVALYSRWWIRWAGRHYQEESQVEDRSNFEQSLEEKAAIVGFPALDAAAKIDPTEVRRRWNIPQDQPVVLLLPFPQGVGKGSFWPSMIFGQPSKFRRAFNVLAHRRFKYWPDIWHDSTDASVVKAIRAFCDLNGAYLLVKSRKKTPIPPYTHELADKCLYDEKYYPSTIFEALSISSLSISFYSTAVIEAASLGVPHLCITFSADDYCGDDELLRGRLERFYTAEEGSPFHFPGVTKAVTIAEAIEDLPQTNLDEFTIEPTARQCYLKQYAGPDDHQSSERLIETLIHQLHDGS